MKRIESFSVDHMKLLPGVYLSRRDNITRADAFSPLGEDNLNYGETGEAYPVSTYDIRITRPNFEPVMSTGEIHTIEHIAATYLRNRDDIKNRVIYWGPMGCRTGFYLILSGAVPVEKVRLLMLDVFRFTADFEGDIPGASPEECGNYSDMDLPAAKKRAEKYLRILENFKCE